MASGAQNLQLYAFDVAPEKKRKKKKRVLLTNEDITNQGRYLLNQFIHERLDKYGVEGKPGFDQLHEPGTPLGPPMEHLMEVNRALRAIADDLDKDLKLQELLSQVQLYEDRQVLLQVARNLFDDGVFTWGRVVALFYFAYVVSCKFLYRIPVMRGIINLIVDFMRDYVVEWIRSRGGWEAIREYFGTSTRQVALVATAGVCVGLGVFIYKNWV